MAKVIRKGKKNWVSIVGPNEFKNVVIGESYVYASEDLIGKKLNVNLSTLVGNPRRQNINIGFEIVEAKEKQANAEVRSYEMMTAHVRRLVRSGKEKIDDSFLVNSKDNMKLRIKPIVLTRNKTKNSVLTKIRKKIIENSTKTCASNNAVEFFNGVISGQFQKDLKQEVNKIYPLSAFEIRKLEVIK